MKYRKLFTVMTISVLLTGCSGNGLTLINETGTKELELGSSYTLNKEDFLDKDKMSNESIEKSVFQIELPEKFEKLEEYEGTVELAGLFGIKNTKNIKVVVKDTTPPSFKKEMPTEIKVEQNAKGVQWCNYFKSCNENGETPVSPYIEDLQTVTVVVEDTDKVDLSKAGQYEITVKATDASKNTAETKVRVLVVDSGVVQKGELPTPTLDKELPVSEATETKIVEGKVNVANGVKATVDGKEVKKGRYSTDEKQKAYEKKLAEEKKKKEEEARKKAEAEEKARQAELARQQQSYNYNYSQPTYSQSVTANKNTGSNNTKNNNNKNTQNTVKPTQPVQTPQRTKPDYTALGEKTFWTREEAIAYGQQKFEEGWGYAVHSEGSALNPYYSVELF